MTKALEVRRWNNGNGVDVEIRSEYGAGGQLVSLTADEVDRLMELLADYKEYPRLQESRAIFDGENVIDNELPFFGHPEKGLDHTPGWVRAFDRMRAANDHEPDYEPDDGEVVR